MTETLFKGVAMRQSLVFALVASLLLFGSSVGSGQAQAGVQVRITAPTDGFITLDPKLKVQGTAQAPAGAKLDLVLVSVNGKAQKATLKPDGNFEADIELEYFGQNIVSATAITDDKQIGSARVTVNLQRRVLFFDDFGGTKPRLEWAPAVGDWIIDLQGHTYTISNITWNAGATTYIRTSDSVNWKDYAVEVDIIDGGKGSIGVGIIVRAQDDTHKVLFVFDNDDDYAAWYTMTNNTWKGPLNRVSGSLATARARVRVEVVGNIFTAYVNGIKRTSYIDQDNLFPQGMPGLYIHYRSGNQGTSFDNFKVESLEARPESALAVEKESPPTPDWELIKTQLAQLSPRLQDLDSRINTLQVAVGSVSKNLPEASVTPEDLSALSQRLDSLERLLQAQVQGQGKEIESLKASLGEQIAQIKRMSDAVDRMAEEFAPLHQRVESAAAKAENIEGKAMLGLIVGAAGVALALLVVLGILR